ncbi:MAG: nucleotidyltransferase family protein [Thaumarchaeota archaeon]|nr:nucleotidyltransferase family protein [Nitrososphaerota archaeon]
MRRRHGVHKFVSAVVLAAGSSKRLGRLKQLARLEGRPLLERTLDAVRRSNVDEVIVVIGDQAAEVRRKVDLSPFVVVVNKSFNEGMSASIKLGLSAVDRRAAAALIVLADQPFLSASLIDGIVELFQKSDALIVAPTHGGVQGNPVLISRRLFSEVSAISGDVGAKSLLGRHSEELLEYPVKDPEPLVDIDTPRDLALARKILKKTSGIRRKTIQ